MNPLLRAIDVSKSFAGVHALQCVSFELRAGEVHALVGENGAGKSTLTKIITGAVQTDEGTLEWNGLAIETIDPVISRSCCGRDSASGIWPTYIIDAWRRSRRAKTACLV